MVFIKYLVVYIKYLIGFGQIDMAKRTVLEKSSNRSFVCRLLSCVCSVSRIYKLIVPAYKAHSRSYVAFCK